MFNFGQTGRSVVRRVYRSSSRSPLLQRRVPVTRRGVSMNYGPVQRYGIKSSTLPTGGRGRFSGFGNPCYLTKGRIGAYTPGINLNRNVGLTNRIIWRG